MIEIQKKIFVYSYLLQEIYCCDCFFDRVMSLINSSEEFTDSKFINILKKEFQDYVIFLFGGQILLICRELIELILKIKKDDEAILKSSCFVHFISDGNEIIKNCPNQCDFSK